MAVDTFIPEIWAATLLSNIRKNHVFGAVMNRNYEGEIAEAGDTVNINSVGSVTVSGYTKNSTTISRQTLATTQKQLVIDQSKYFAFDIDDVDARQVAAQSNLLSEALVEAAFALADLQDTYLAGLYTGVAAGNAIGTVSITSTALAAQAIRDLRQKLNEADVRSQGRYVIVPPWFEALLMDNSLFVAVDSSGSNDALRNGMIGRLYGFDVHMSNNCVNSAGDDWIVQAGVDSAITFADQIASVEAYRPESSFSDAVKGLHLYGAKLVQPTGIATIAASIT